MLQLNWPIFLFLCMIVSGGYLITAIVLDHKGEDWGMKMMDRDTDRSTLWWTYNILSFMLIFFLTQMNFKFLFYAFWDGNRKLYLIKQASAALELDFYRKDQISVRMPVLNFMDRKSLLTWLETRKLILETGSRF